MQARTQDYQNTVLNTSGDVGYEQLHTTIDQQYHMDIRIAHSTYIFSDDPNFEFNVSTTKSSAIVKFVTNNVKSSDESDYAVISQPQ